MRANTEPSNKKHYDWKSLRQDGEIRSSFEIKLHNKFEALYDESKSIFEQFQAYVDANNYAAEETLPTIQKSKYHKHANHPAIVLARKKVDILNKRYNTSKSHIVRKHLKAAKQFLQAEYQKLDEEILKKQIAETEADFHANNTAKAW